MAGQRLLRRSTPTAGSLSWRRAEAFDVQVAREEEVLERGEVVHHISGDVSQWGARAGGDQCTSRGDFDSDGSYGDGDDGRRRR
jgi:hypothetical protein